MIVAVFVFLFRLPSLIWSYSPTLVRTLMAAISGSSAGPWTLALRPALRCSTCGCTPYWWRSSY